MTNTALLVLEDGEVYAGEAFGAEGTAFGEVVFNTGMSGYQEVLTDPSYRSHLVAMTYPHQGNYGITATDDESERVQAAGLIVRSVARRASNHLAVRNLPQLLAASGVIGITEVDTRRLTRHVRTHGAKRGVISTTEHDVDALVVKARSRPTIIGSDLVSGLEQPEPQVLSAGSDQRFKVVAWDFGMKRGQLRQLTGRGCEVVVVPATTTASEILAYQPDGVFLSNGPGDPAALDGIVAHVRELLAAQVPTFGICLGHQLLGLAVGATTFKLPFGHHGLNHPVRNHQRAAVEITSQNHGFAVVAESLPGPDGPFGAVVATHTNLNDQTNAGLRCVDIPAFSVQYHPESAPGPHDSRYLFDQFIELMEAGR